MFSTLHLLLLFEPVDTDNKLLCLLLFVSFSNIFLINNIF
jgi:hypothetical protein